LATALIESFVRPLVAEARTARAKELKQEGVDEG